MSLHVPVLLRPVSRLIFSVTSSPRVLDLTLGTGGYSSAFLEEQGGCRVVGVDRDPSQVATVDRLSRRDQLEPESFDAVVADLGLCTTQLEDISRGFSFRGKDMDALDMRMSNEGPTAADLLNTMSESDMIAMFAQLGQEPLQRARAIASRIIKERPIKSVAQFAKILRTEKTMLVPKHLDPATLGFQALRMTVNREIPELVSGLSLAARVLKKSGGVLVFVSYHSIEDRIVKKFIQLSSSQKDKETPCLEKGEDFVRPDESEVASNPRASSATLRYAFRNDLPFVRDVTEQLTALALKRKM